MKKFAAILATGAALIAFAAGTAGAATLSLVGGTPVTLDSTFDPTPVIAGIGPGDTVTNFSGLNLAGQGLYLSGPANVTFTYLGKEAYFSNRAVELVNDGTVRLLDDVGVGDSISFSQLASGLLQFRFRTAGLGGQSITNGVGSTNTALDMAFKWIDSRTVFALFGDGGFANDNDYDDMVIRIQVAAVPVPAAGFLLIGALGGLAALRRRKTA